MTRIATLSLCMVLLLSTLAMVDMSAPAEARDMTGEVPYTGRGPITINSNADFQVDGNGVVNWGDTTAGTAENPWIIEGWEISGGWVSNCINISATTEHFVIRNCNLYNAGPMDWNYPYSDESAIALINVINGTVEGNEVIDNVIGIYLYESHWNTIRRNNASLNIKWAGIILEYASNNTVADNNVDGNWDGAYVAFSSNDNWVVNNTFSNNSGKGLFTSSTENNTICGNNIVNNDHGIYMEASSGCKIYHNSIANSTTFNGYDDTGSNDWNMAYPVGGNFWDNYTDIDANSGPLQNQPGADGIWDNPYMNINGSMGAQDNYPLTAPFADNAAPIVDVGADVIASTQFPKIATANDPAPSSGIANYTWSTESGIGTVIFGTQWEKDTTIEVGAEDIYMFKLTVTDNAGNSGNDTFQLTWDATAPDVHAGSDEIRSTTFNSIADRVANATASDAVSGIDTYAWTQQAGPGTITFSADNALATDISADTDGTYTVRLTVSDNAGNIDFSEFQMIWDTTPPSVEAGSDELRDFTFSSTAERVVNATAEDATSGIASYAWTQQAGPGTITFSAPDDLTTDIYADIDGVYTIRLNVTDNAGFPASDEFQLTWDKNAPTVEAGSDEVRRALFNSTAGRAVPASASDANGIASYQWSKHSGPGNIIFSAPNALSTDISADTDGIYFVKLLVTDNAGRSSFDTFRFTWDITSPTVNAGSDEIRSAAFSAVSGRATVASAADTTSGIVAYAWTKASGTGTVTFSAPNALTTDIIASAEGNYVIRLTVTDNAGNSAFDEFNLTWDITPPSVAATSPANEGTGIPTAPGSFIFDFSEDMDQNPPGGPDSNMPLIDGAWASPTRIAVSYGALEEYTAYYINITSVGLTDIAGNAIAGTNNFTFMTADSTLPTVSAGSDEIRKALFNSTSGRAEAANASDTGSGIATYAWTKTSGPGTVTFSADNALTTNIQASQDGNYVIRLTVTDIVGNIAFDEFNLTWNTNPADQPVAEAGSDESRNAKFYTADQASRAVPASISKGVGALTITWFKVSGPGDAIWGSARSLNTSVRVTMDGTYILKLTVEDAVGNIASDTFELVWDSTPPGAMDATTGDASTGGTYTFRVTITDSNIDSVHVIYRFGTGTPTNASMTPVRGQDYTRTVTLPTDSLDTMHYRFAAVDLMGHWTSTGESQIQLTDGTAPVANAGQDQSVEAGATVTFDGSGSTDNIGITGYEWTFNDGSRTVTLQGVSPTRKFNIPGTYNVTLTVTDAAGNTHTDTMTVTVTGSQAITEDRQGGDAGWVLILAVIVIIVLLLVALLMKVTRAKPAKDHEPEEPEAANDMPAQEEA